MITGAAEGWNVSPNKAFLASFEPIDKTNEDIIPPIINKSTEIVLSKMAAELGRRNINNITQPPYNSRMMLIMTYCVVASLYTCSYYSLSISSPS